MTVGYLFVATILFSCILADRFSGKFGMPALILFMAVERKSTKGISLSYINKLVIVVWRVRKLHRVNKKCFLEENAGLL